jgi:hypothetical protein
MPEKQLPRRAALAGQWHLRRFRRIFARFAG